MEKRVSGRELKVGDTINVWWRAKSDRIVKLESYNGPLSELLGNGAMIATFALNKTGMTIEPDSIYEVVA